jgi:hypothetical protein
MKRKQYSLLLIVLIAACIANAQTAGYHYKAAINPVKESGLYNIVLTPAISAHLKIDYSDLRIVNDAGKWVPHLLQTSNCEKSNETVLWTLPFSKIEDVANNTSLIITNKNGSISNLFLQMKNTTAERYCILTGSDDGKNWFIINDSILINPSIMDDKNSTGFNISFPKSNYVFYRILINNKGKATFNILGVQTTAPAINSFLHAAQENPPPAIFQQDSSQYSFVKVTNVAAYHFSEIQLNISAAKYFYRRVSLYIPSAANHSFSNPGLLLHSFIISNKSTLQYKIPITNAPVFYLIISNEDNLPLKIESLKTFNSCQTVTAYLEKENQYELMMGNAAATTPSYDLQQININTVTSIPEASISNIVAINQPLVNTAKNDTKWLIWMAILIAGLVLSFFTYKLVMDINKVKL